MHIVTFDNERFATLGDAVGKENGIAVLGILFKVSSSKYIMITFSII